MPGTLLFIKFVGVDDPAPVRVFLSQGILPKTAAERKSPSVYADNKSSCIIAVPHLFSKPLQ
jgi:hypothetical protein